MALTRRQALLHMAAGSAALTLAPAAARAVESHDPLPRTKDYIVALVRGHPGIDSRTRPIQKIEPVAFPPDAKSSPDNALVFDHFVGDLHLRYVFDDPSFMLALRVRDLKRLKIKREELPTIVVDNYRRLYPKLTINWAERWLGVLMNGGELEPCTMLDGGFWQRQERAFGTQLIAVVPSVQEVYFTPGQPQQNVGLLKNLATQQYEKAGKHAVSRTVFAWRGYRWEVVA
jgi:hypothetical protein